jgi:hypothetical protein
MKHSIHRALPPDLLARTCGTAASKIGLTPDRIRYNSQIRWAIGFVVTATVLVGGMLLLIWALSGFGSLGVSGHGLVALVLGTLLTSALGIGLMALSFYGDHSSESDTMDRTDTKAERGAD